MSSPFDIPGSIATTPGQNNIATPESNDGAKNVIGYPPGSLVGTDAGSTSGVTGWVPDIITICNEAAEHASVDSTSGYFLRSAKRSLDLLSMSWSNYGLNLWLLDQIETPLIVGQEKYAMPQDTIDLLAPAISTQQGLIYGEPNIQDILIAREDFQTYLSQPNKQYRGKPVVVFVNRIVPPEFYLWPTPGNAQPYTLKWWRLRRPMNTGYATNRMDIPPFFVPSITYGLAWQLALKKKVKDYTLIAFLKANYNEEFERAREENRDRSPIYLAPYIPYD